MGWDFVGYIIYGADLGVVTLHSFCDQSNWGVFVSWLSGVIHRICQSLVGLFWSNGYFNLIAFPFRMRIDLCSFPNSAAKVNTHKLYVGLIDILYIFISFKIVHHIIYHILFNYMPIASKTLLGSYLD